MSDKTKQKVLEAIRQLDYTPDTRAQSLRGIKTGLIGVVIPEASSAYYQELSRTIMNVCYKQEFGVLTCSSENDVKRELFYIDFLQGQKVDGIIIVSERLKAQKVNDLIRKEIPIVLLDEDIPGTEAPAVVTDYHEGASEAVQYLIDLGHEKIAFIKGRMSTPSAKQRLEGYIDTLRRNNLKVDDILIKQGDFSYESGYEITKQLLRECRKYFTAIFCSCDLMAFGAIQCIHDMGECVPSDYSVVGFDNTYYSTINVPPLTTVAQPNLELARIAFDLIRKWTRGEERKHLSCKPRLIIRDSCRAL
jgi:DNA-binding LacI/PurR family transcriptional regulator